MIFWLDANLDPDLAAWLGSRFKVLAKHVREMALQRISDRELFDAARRAGNVVIITKDMDFVDLVTRYGPPPQVMRLTCGNLSTPAMHVLLSRNFGDAIRLVESGETWVEIG